MMPALKTRQLDYQDPLEFTAAGLKRVAQAIFNERSMEFVSGRGSCIGLPELVPGPLFENRRYGQAYKRVVFYLAGGAPLFGTGLYHRL